jgi:thiol-disulfide isomerase/thioredoxin
LPEIFDRNWGDHDTMARFFFWISGLTATTVLIAGCSGNSSAETSQTKAPAPASAANQLASAAADAPAAADNVPLSILSFDEIQELIAGKRGKVVVMDAWSTSCPPCLKDFHNLVELHKQYPASDLACVSLSFDFEGGVGSKPEDVREPVLAFLRSQGATFDNVVSNEESDVLYRKFKLNAVPAIFVYDRQGKLRERFEKEGAYEKVRALVAELVKEPAPAATSPTDP